MIRQLRDGVLAVYLSDDVKARQMNTTGAYTRRKTAEGRKQVNAQEQLLQKRRAAARGKKNNRKPHPREEPGERG